MRESRTARTSKTSCRHPRHHPGQHPGRPPELPPMWCPFGSKSSMKSPSQTKTPTSGRMPTPFSRSDPSSSRSLAPTPRCKACSRAMRRSDRPGHERTPRPGPKQPVKHTTLASTAKNCSSVRDFSVLSSMPERSSSFPNTGLAKPRSTFRHLLGNSDQLTSYFPCQPISARERELRIYISSDGGKRSPT